MRRLLEALARWIIRHFLWFIMIAVLLASANWLRSELRELDRAREALTVLRDAETNVQTRRRALEGELVKRLDQMEMAPLKNLDARIRQTDSRLAALAPQQRSPGTGLPDVFKAPISEQVIAHLEREIEIELLTQERDYLRRLRAVAATRDEREAAAGRLAELHREHVAVYQSLSANERAQERLKEQYPVTAWMLGFPEYAKHAELRRAHKSLLRENQRAHDAYVSQQKRVAGMKGVDERIRFVMRTDGIDARLQPLREAVEGYEARAAANRIARFSGPLLEVAPAAGWLVLSVVLVPLALKFLFYFLLAPLASRQPAIRLLPDTSGAIDGWGHGAKPDGDGEKISSVSRPLMIDPGREMLVHPQYIQSAFTGGKKNTKWLMDWSFPFTSLAAGLVAMTRIRTDSPASVVVSATDDPLTEIALISLPAGSAIVLQPRSLIGALYRAGEPPRITRHWRLGSLHAWLTLQLRYLVFHGEATLLVKGCRGVRVETAGKGRSINQAATIGFTANADYKTIRTETFWPYLSGRQQLLDDSFGGVQAFYLYEETPFGGRQPGIAGRGLQGLTDSILKVFGI